MRTALIPPCCVALALALAPVLGAPSPAVASPGPSRLEFVVVRNGEDVGRHVIDFTRNGNSTSVRISTNVVVKIAFITVYRFEHQGIETWRGNHLVALRSQTNDDGTAHHLNVAMQGDHLEVAGDGPQRSVSATILPASLWNQGIVHQSTLLNTLDGTQMRVSVQDKGEDIVPAEGTRIRAHHFTISGGLNRDVWFDANNTLVRVQFAAKDGSTIVYQLR
jgi:Domain of unknown function (DUF6134)